MPCKTHHIMFGLSQSLPYGIYAYSGIQDYRAMFFFLEIEEF